MKFVPTLLEPGRAFLSKVALSLPNPLAGAIKAAAASDGLAEAEALALAFGLDSKDLAREWVVRYLETARKKHH